MNKFKDEIVKLLKKELNLKEVELTIPPDPNLGDFAFPCFVLAKRFQKNPTQIAKELAVKIKPKGSVGEIKAAGPYLNFYLDNIKMAGSVLKGISANKDYGRGSKKKERVMVEFFHANTHKGVHIGHLRNISMSDALCRILKFSGYKVIRTNYQGDIGPHVAKCIWGYLNLKQKEPKEQKGVWLGKMYSLASKIANENKKVEKEIKQINNKLYAKDKELMKIWKKTRKYCLDDFNKFYKEFDVKFDRLYFESEVEEPGKRIVRNMLKKGWAKESEGAIIMDLEKYDLGIYVLITKEGNALYPAKDLGLAALKQKEFKFDKSIHVTGAEQTLYFKQIFKTFEIIGSKMAEKSVHIPYGLVMLPEGKMSSREGTMVLFDELRKKIFETAEKATKEKHKGLSKKELKERTMKITYGALKFSMINRENNKDLVFDWDKALDFEGETGPYVQYAHARICSVLRKYKKKIPAKINFGILNTKEEKKIIILLSRFPDVVADAGEHYRPHVLCRYMLDLSQAFNEFYHAHRILQAAKTERDARIYLINCVKQILAEGLDLLGIEAPERM